MTLTRNFYLLVVSIFTFWHLGRKPEYFFHHCLLTSFLQFCWNVFSTIASMKWSPASHCSLSCSNTDTLPSDPVQQQYNFWLSLVDKLGVKAFVDLTLSPSVRQGTQHLLRITGLGELWFSDLSYPSSDAHTQIMTLHSVTLVHSFLLLSTRWHEAQHAGFGFLWQLHSWGLLPARYCILWHFNGTRDRGRI